MSSTAWHVAEVVVMLLLPLLIAGGLVLVERRLLGQLQDRYGPNRVGVFGEMQVLADAIKLLAQGGLDTPVRRPAGLRGRPGHHPRVGAGQFRRDPA